jgi:hypothetical protein
MSPQQYHLKYTKHPQVNKKRKAIRKTVSLMLVKSTKNPWENDFPALKTLLDLLVDISKP